MKYHYPLAILLAATLCHTSPAQNPARPGPSATPSAPAPVIFWGYSGRIDELVSAKLTRLRLTPAPTCTDAVFLRRIYLDAIGTLPTVEEVRAFLDDKSPGKRAALVERLLNREEFAEYWGMKWCDLLRVKAEFPVNLWPNAAQAYDRWIRTSLQQNIPYSQFAWELLTANGSNFRVPQVNFYRSVGSKDPKAIARGVALTFMGERAEQWPEEKLSDMAVFFSQIGFKSTNEWKEEIVHFTGNEAGKETVKKATLPDGTKVQIPPGKDPRELFARWLIQSPSSPFARNAVNRLWYWVMGRGIIHEPDDSRPDNPPSNPELLAYLAQELVANRFDTRHLLRMIFNSHTYQRSSLPAGSSSGSVKTEDSSRHFASYPLRRIEAELIIDSINQITGATDEYSSMIPEPFTWVPTEKRSISLPDGSISSTFLDLFGRPPRDTGFLNERNNRTTAAQRLHLLNSTHIHGKITKSERLKKLFAGNPAPACVEQIYLMVLSRYPTPAELETFTKYAQTSEARGTAALQDLTWALINGSEFLHRH